MKIKFNKIRINYIFFFFLLALNFQIKKSYQSNKKHNKNIAYCNIIKNRIKNINNEIKLLRNAKPIYKLMEQYNQLLKSIITETQDNKHNKKQYINKLYNCSIEFKQILSTFFKRNNINKSINEDLKNEITTKICDLSLLICLLKQNNSDNQNIKLTEILNKKLKNDLKTCIKNTEMYIAQAQMQKKEKTVEVYIINNFINSFIRLENNINIILLFYSLYEDLDQDRLNSKNQDFITPLINKSKLDKKKIYFKIFKIVFISILLNHLIIFFIKDFNWKMIKLKIKNIQSSLQGIWYFLKGSILEFKLINKSNYSFITFYLSSLMILLFFYHKQELNKYYDYINIDTTLENVKETLSQSEGINKSLLLIKELLFLEYNFFLKYKKLYFLKELYFKKKKSLKKKRKKPFIDNFSKEIESILAYSTIESLPTTLSKLESLKKEKSLEKLMSNTTKFTINKKFLNKLNFINNNNLFELYTNHKSKLLSLIQYQMPENKIKNAEELFKFCNFITYNLSWQNLELLNNIKNSSYQKK